MLNKENSNLNGSISKVSFGGASLSGEGGGYGFGQMSESQSEKLILSAWESGVTLFDTAPIYGFGLSEQRLGRYLPKDAKVITKSGVDWHENMRVNLSNEKIITEKMLHESLKRLKREVIDIYMIHWPDPNCEIRVPLEVLIRAQEAGKIKKIGLCNTNLHDLKKATDLCRIDAIQSELNIFNPDSFLSLGEEWKDKLSMSWGTFDKGILSGRVTKERVFSKEDARSWAPWWKRKEVLAKLEKVQKLKMLLDQYGISLQAFCLHFNLHHIGVSTCLVGFKSAADIQQVFSSLDQKIGQETMTEILTRFKSIP